MKSVLLISFLLLAACSKKNEDQAVYSEDYVLIEFASKLEEDYHKFNIEGNQMDAPHDDYHKQGSHHED